MPLAALVAPVLGAFGVSAGTAGLIGAGVSVAGSLLGGNNGSGGIGSNPAVDAANTAANTQLSMFNKTQANLQPFMSAGTGALSQLASIFGFGPGGTGAPNASAAMSQLAQFPGYQFGLNQGVQTLDRSAASRGLLQSGAQEKAITQFGQNYAQQQAWQPYVSELQWASNLGENASAGVGQLGATAAQGAAQSQLAAGSAALNGQTAAANNLNSALAQYGLTNPGNASGLNLGGTPIPLQTSNTGAFNTVAPNPANVDIVNQIPDYTFG